MKTNTERLAAALTQVDDSGMIFVDDFALQVDGYFEKEPLDGAIDTHLAPLSSIAKRQKPLVMYLRQGIADGTADDGRPFELSMTNHGLVLSVGKFDENRIVETIGWSDLVEAWLRTIGAVKP